MIPESTLRRLEFPKIFDQLIEMAPSRGVRDLLLARGFATDQKELERRQSRLAEAIQITESLPLRIGVLHSMEEAVDAAQKGRSLDIPEFLDLLATLKSMRELKEFFQEQESSRFPLLMDEASLLLSFRPLEERLLKTFDEDGEVRSRASDRLHSLRQQISRAESNLRKRIDSYLSDSSYRDYLMDEIITLRDDRFVLPVRAEHKRRVPGLVHDRSASGQTLYIEPAELVEMNNHLRELRAEEEEEIRRILRELSQTVGSHAEPFLYSLEAAFRISLEITLARFGLSQHGHLAQLSQDRRILFRKARHPLLDPKTVVPMDMDFGLEDSVLVITGPNTGGKTVALKTVGLLCLMHQFGMAVPASEGSALPFFEKIYADIGDEQSIEQSLSTFSSHMTNIVSIMQRADHASLILLDELGAGTDPQEGAALAQSILRELKSRGAVVMATSHYSEVKQFAMVNAGYCNASVEFDRKSLRPTYRLMMGVPGSSNAFEISRQLGMGDPIIESAKRIMDEQKIELEELLAELESQRLERERLQQETLIALEDAKDLRLRYEERLQRFQDQRDKLLEEARSEAREILRDTQRESREIMKKLRAMRDSKFDYAEMEEQQRLLKEGQEKLKSRPKKAYRSPDKLEVGDSIYVPKLGSLGEVLSKPDETGNFRAALGVMKVNLNITEVEKRSVKQENFIPKVTAEIQPRSLQKSLDLRGKNMEDARIEVDHFLDQAVMGRLEKVEIIHGKGTGVLRQFITEYLKKHPHVAEARLGGYYEGGSGVTIVHIK